MNCFKLNFYNYFTTDIHIHRLRQWNKHEETRLNKQIILFMIKYGKDQRMQGEGAGSSEPSLICSYWKMIDFSSLKRHWIRKCNTMTECSDFCVHMLCIDTRISWKLHGTAVWMKCCTGGCCIPKKVKQDEQKFCTGHCGRHWGFKVSSNRLKWEGK
jgi:hypothetical protein